MRHVVHNEIKLGVAPETGWEVPGDLSRFCLWDPVSTLQVGHVEGASEFGEAG